MKSLKKEHRYVYLRRVWSFVFSVIDKRAIFVFIHFVFLTALHSALKDMVRDLEQIKENEENQVVVKKDKPHHCE